MMPGASSGRGLWDRAEAAFRYVAFTIFYNRTLRHVSSADWRFLRALQLSSRPIPPAKRQEVIAWFTREHPTCRRQTGCPGKRESMKHLTLILLLALCLFACGCQSLQTAPAAYRFANQARFNAVSPWLTEYAAEHPDKAPRVNDVVKSWDIEVQAQRSAATQPTQ